MRFRTNIQPQKRTRRKPQAGDVFTFHVAGRGWLFGRVAATACQGEAGITLVYVYKIVQDSATHVPRLDKGEILFPPTFACSYFWTEGYFVTVQEGPPRPGDLFERHCFDNTFGRFVDENWNLIKEPFAPCGNTGIHGLVSFDDAISDALGIPRIPEEQKKITREAPRGNKDGPGEVALYIPGEGDRRKLEWIEEHIRGAVESAGAGVWEGHGFDLDKGVFDTRFRGKSGRRLLDAVRSAVASLRPRIPGGSYAVLRPRRGDWEERAEL